MTIGNLLAKTCLERMVQNQCVPQTLLFAGPEGVGKGIFALTLAKMIMGPQHVRKIEASIHPDIHIYRPEGKSGMHSMAEMRRLIDEVALPPFEAPGKVFILHDAERMLPTSSNALLKTFEEPPTDTYIILLSSEPDAILSTILSRCRKIPFFPVSEAEITAFIQAQFQKPSEEAARIALFAQGSVAKACALAHQSEDPKRQLVAEILQCHNVAERLKALSKLDELIESSNVSEEGEASGLRIKDIDAVLEQILHWYRERYDHYDLEKVLYALLDCRSAIQHNVKLRVSLQKFFLSV